ncbi:restriction endonuclease subunit S [Lactobacillus delbrueckii subsp. allosunkii]|uniref:restriction endonuclease subunit S n=1 Tax=Lactobacillus delbrueckii TaxID=1584 RepID=UPI003A8912BC
MGVSTPALPSVEYDDINPGIGTLNKEPKSKGTSKRGIHFNPGDVLFGKLRPYLKNWLFACFEGVAVGDFWVLTSSKIDHGFTYSLIQAPEFQYIANLSSGSKMPRSDWGLVSNARTFIPTNLSEQKSISSVLFGLDTAITLHEEKKHQLERLKSALLQKMFADESGYPVVRFEGFSDEWEQCKLGDVADRVTTKNKGMVSELPLTISAQDGLISQDEFFNKKVASKDLSSYLLLHHGDFAYNKSYSNGYPFGTIKRLEKYPQGVVSSLYIAFKPNSSISSDFMAQYYESNNWHKEIYKCAAEGARNHGLLNIPPSDFFATNLNIPITKSEQLKIGRLLNAVDHTFTLHDQKLSLLKRVKQTLLQKMFI